MRSVLRISMMLILVVLLCGSLFAEEQAIKEMNPLLKRYIDPFDYTFKFLEVPIRNIPVTLQVIGGKFSRRKDQKSIDFLMSQGEFLYKIDTCEVRIVSVDLPVELTTASPLTYRFLCEAAAGTEVVVGVRTQAEIQFLAVEIQKTIPGDPIQFVKDPIQFKAVLDAMIYEEGQMHLDKKGGSLFVLKKCLFKNKPANGRAAGIQRRHIQRKGRGSAANVCSANQRVLLGSLELANEENEDFSSLNSSEEIMRRLIESKYLNKMPVCPFGGKYHIESDGTKEFSIKCSCGATISPTSSKSN